VVAVVVIVVVAIKSTGSPDQRRREGLARLNHDDDSDGDFLHYHDHIGPHSNGHIYLQRLRTGGDA
jgi:hypothetical protein